MLHPRNELSYADVNSLKKYAKAVALHRAVTQGKGDPSEYIVREIVPGDTGSPADFCDLDMVNPVAANCQYWTLAAGDQTTDTYDNWLESQTVADGQWMVFTGYFDLCPQMNVIADAVGGAPLNTHSRVQFLRGGSPISVWETQQLYAQQDAVVGFTDEPVFFDQNITPQIKNVVNEATISKPIGLRGYLVEKRGTINPVDQFKKQLSYEETIMVDLGDGMGPISLPVPLGGFEPRQEMALDQISAIKERTRDGLISMALRDGAIGSPDEALVMEVLVGDPSVTEDVDLYLSDATAYDAGNMMWAIDSAELVTLALHNIQDESSGYNKVADNTYLGFYGLTDNTNVPKMNAVEFMNSSTVLDFWHVQHMYAYQYPAGYSERPVFYDQNDKIILKIRVSDTAQDIFPVFKGMVCINKANRIGGT